MNKITKAIAGVVAIAAFAVAGVSSASAATSAELQAQITALMAQLQASTGGSVSMPATTFTRDLSLGASGADVTALQNWLMSKGYAIPAGATGYYGAQTQSAVKAYQMAKNLPATGYFGPLTRGAVAAETAVVVTTPPVTTGGTSTGGTSTGGSSSSDEGYLDEFEEVSGLNNEEVGEDEEDVEVLGVEFEAKDADQTIERVSVVIDTPTGNDDLEDFITEVSVWLDGEELDRMSVEDAGYDRGDDEYTFRFTGLDGEVAEGDKAELVVAVTGVNNLDSGDEGEGWTIEIPSNGIRAVSPNGVDDTYDSSAFNTGFTIESFASASDLEMNVTLSDDNPDEGVAIVDDEGDEIVLLAFDIEADGGDVSINDIPLVLASTNANVGAILDEVTLEWDGDSQDENGDGNLNSTSETFLFEDLDLTIDEGDTMSFRVVAKSATSSVTGAQAVSLSATVNPDNIDAEDASGEDIADADATGSANGETQHLYTDAVEVEVVSVDIDPIDNGTAAPEAATAKIKVKLTARGSTIYLNGDDETTAADEFFVVAVDGGNASTSISSWSHTTSGTYTTTNSGSDNEYYTVNEDKSITVEITGVVSQSVVTTSSVLAGMRGTAIQFGTDATSQATRSSVDLTWSDLTDELKSGKTPLVNPS